MHPILVQKYNNNNNYYYYYSNTFIIEAVTIGLQQSYYSTFEGQGPVEICIALLSGDITGSAFTISYTTINGLAEGVK